MNLGEMINHNGRVFIAVEPDDYGFCGSCAGHQSNHGHIPGLCTAVGCCDHIMVLPADEDYQI